MLLVCNGTVRSLLTFSPCSVEIEKILGIFHILHYLKAYLFLTEQCDKVRRDPAVPFDTKNI